MSNTYTVGSFSKNFGWNESYKKLHAAIRNGFSGGGSPVSRDCWRERSKIGDSDQELLAINFFLYSMRGINEDFVLVDKLVDCAFEAYSADFSRLALFALHVASSGNWHRSKWPDGRVAGWANELIRTVAWNTGKWRTE